MLLRILCVIAMGTLLCSSGAGQSNENKSVKPSEPCTTRTGLYCEIYGSGDPILAVHGLGASLYSWRNLKGQLPGHKLILIDLKGAGKSPKPRDKHYSIQEQADLIYQFILEKDLRNLTLVGNSYGGAVSLLLAIRLCEHDRARFSKLILIGSGGYNLDLPFHLKLLRARLIGPVALRLPLRVTIRMLLYSAYYDNKKVTKEQVREYVKPIAARGGRYALLQTARQAIPKNIDEIIPKYKTICVPTLILWGRQDKIIKLKIGEMLHRDIPNSKLVILDEAGHVPQEEQPKKTICEMRKFLEPGYICRD